MPERLSRFLSFILAGGALSATLLLSGCATGSVDNPMGISYSVSAEKITDDHYTILVSGAAVVSEAGIREVGQGRDYKYRLTLEPYTYTSQGGFMAGGIYIPQTYSHNGLRGNGYIYLLSTTTGQAIDLDAAPAPATPTAESKPAN